MGTRLGRYDIIRTLAKGELTDLLLACADGMEGFQRHVAIKRLHASHAKDGGCLEAFVNEARLAAALHHHNIVQVLDIGQESGQPYFAMEYVHGVDLRALLNKLSKRGEQMPLQHVVSIVAAAAAALHHAHEQRGPDGKPLGIVHRDVTPANILVGYDGNIKVVDFGIAKAAIKRIKTDQGVLKGRVPYMAPEQCAGKPIDRRSDVFALGIVTYELATVRRLFKGATEFLTMSAIVNGDIPKPSQYRRDVPPELEQIMLKALARDPANRYQTAGEMALALDEVALHVGVGASTTQLANYMKLQFGEQKEPWLLDAVEEDPETTAVDFDGGASGLAPPPAESVRNNAIPKTIAATRSSPIAQVRNIITPPKGEGPKKAVPLDRSYSMSTEVEATSYDRQTRRESTESDHVPTEPLARTHVASPPPPPPLPTHAGSPTPTDATEIVVPLPPMPTERPVVRRTEPRMLASLGGTSKNRIMIVVAAFAVVVVVAGAIVLWPGSDVPASAAPDRPTQVEARRDERKAKPDEKKPDEQKPDQKPDEQKPDQKPAAQKPEETADTPSGLNATMADYDKAREEQAAAEKVAADKAAADAKAEQDKQAAADEAAVKKQATADEAAAKKQAAADEAAAKKQAAAEEAAVKKQAAADLAATKKQATADKAAAAQAEKQAAAEKAAADKQAKMAATKRAKPAATKTVKRPAPKQPAAKKSTKKGAKWNPDELFLGD